MERAIWHGWTQTGHAAEEYVPTQEYLESSLFSPTLWHLLKTMSTDEFEKEIQRWSNLYILNCKLP